MQELREMVLRAKSKNRVLAVLDCCYSGAITDAKSGSDPAEPQLDAWFKDIEAHEHGRGRMILASSHKDQKSYELCRTHELGGGEAAHHHGVLSYHILEGLDGRAASQGEDYRVTLGGLWRYLDGVPECTVSVFVNSMTKPDEITLVTAKERRTVETILGRVRDLLGKAGTPREIVCTFKAAMELGVALDKSPSLSAAIDLQHEINERFELYRRVAISWHGKNRLWFPESCAENLERLRILLSGLSVQMLRGQTVSDGGYLTSICEAARGLKSKEDLFDELSGPQEPTIGAKPGLAGGMAAAGGKG